MARPKMPESQWWSEIVWWRDLGGEQDHEAQWKSELDLVAGSWNGWQDKESVVSNGGILGSS